MKQERIPENTRGFKNISEYEYFSNELELAHFHNPHSHKKNLSRLAAAGLLIASCSFSDSHKNVATPEQTLFPEKMEMIKGVDMMNQTKDRLHNPRTREEKNLLVSFAKELGVTHVAVATPYSYFIDNSGKLESNDAIDQETREWVEAIRAQNLSVSHRHMFMNFEGIYGEKKDSTLQYVDLMREWMIDNQDLIQPGDTWTPIPEPQNGGIKGNHCEQNICMFESTQEFNKFIREIVNTSRETLDMLKKENVPVICCGFDGFVAWGDNNPDWIGKGLLEEDTVKTIGHIAIDHYPQIKNGIRETYRDDLNELHITWPNVPIYITEVGTIDVGNDESVDDLFHTFSQDPLIKGVWWWQLGPAGPESLINGPINPDSVLDKGNVTKTKNFEEVKKGLKSLTID